jgi:hypothetical protein
MGIFSVWAPNYHDLGLSVIPVLPDHKRPALKDWSKYCDVLPTENEVAKWCNNYKDYNIGLCMGKASGIIAFDFDYDYDLIRSTIKDPATFYADKRFIENELLTHYLPETPCAKKGKKGWTRFYRFNGELNMSVKRNGVQLFDLLSSGRQTVIPPSIHKDTGKAYTWLDENIEDVDIESLPFINYELIQEFAYRYSDGKDKSFKKSRHGKVFTYACSILDLTENDSEVISEMIAFDQKENDPAYLSDKKHMPPGCSNDLDHAAQWLPRIKTFASKGDANGKSDGRVALTKDQEFDAYKFFFEKQLRGARKCRVRGTVLQKRGELWNPVLNEIRPLRSKARGLGLKPQPLEDHIYRWCDEMKGEFLFKLPVWDNINRIDKLISHLGIVNISHNAAVELFTDWAVKVIKRAHSWKVQNRCLVLKGPQGIGKDVFFSKLCRVMDPYFAEISLSSQNKNNFESITGQLIVNVPEMDGARDVAVETIKDLITRNSADFRAPYDKEATKRYFYCSFLATCNRDDLLRDSTGNRRFIIFDVDKIDWGYSEMDLGMVWAEVVKLAESGFYASDNSEAEIDEYIDEHTPESPEESILAEFDEAVRKINKFMVPRPDWLSGSDVSELIAQLAKNHMIRPQTIKSILKRNGRKIGRGNRAKYPILDICDTSGVTLVHLKEPRVTALSSGND